MDLWVPKILWRRKWELTTVFLPGKSHEQRSLVGSSPRVTESQTRLTMHASCITEIRKPAEESGGQSLSCVQTLCNPMDCSPLGSSIHGISQQEYWSGLPCPPPGDHPNPRDGTCGSCISGGFFTLSHQGSLPVR